MQLTFDLCFDLPQARAKPARLVTKLLPSFDEIVDAHYQGLYRFALSLCKSEARAQDLVQQTFLQWAKKGHTLREADKLDSFSCLVGSHLPQLCI